MALKNLIHGNLVDSGILSPIINPATEESFTEVYLAGESLLEQAVSSSTRAFQNWRQTSINERRAALEKIADLMAANKEKLAKNLTREQGKILNEAYGEIDLAENFCRYYAAMDMPVETLVDNDDVLIESHRKPLGVVAAIIPWNYPFFVMINKLAPALLAGNVVIIKPAPTTPVTTLVFAELIVDILPPGVVNILADDTTLGPMITAHPAIAKISFTGSTATGKSVYRTCASSLKRMTLELGGNDAAILLDDAVPENITGMLFEAIFENCGQVCNAIKRLYVPESLYGEMTARLAEMASGMIIGDGMDPATNIGPLQNKNQFDLTCALIEESRKDGTLIAGGIIPDRKGYFIPPTLFKDIHDGCRLVDQEQFGPVLPIISYRSLDDTLAQINSSPYGLTGSVWSADPRRARDVALSVESGTLWVNQHGMIGPHIPSSPMKQSGLGTEGGQEGLYSFTAQQIIHVRK